MSTVYLAHHPTLPMGRRPKECSQLGIHRTRELFIGLSFLTKPLADLVQPLMTVLIETGYDRTSYGTPTPFQLIPTVNPLTLGANLVSATVQGIEDALGDIHGTRPTPPPTQDPFTTAASLFAGSDEPTPDTSPARARPTTVAIAPNAKSPKGSAHSPLRSNALSLSQAVAPETTGTAKSGICHSGASGAAGTRVKSPTHTNTTAAHG
jgi:hypothetical protein